MAVNQLIAQGGRPQGSKSPVQRYLETRQQMEQQEKNKLAMQAQRQNMAINQQTMQMKQREQQAAMAESYGKAIAPILQEVNKADDKQAAYEKAFPIITQTAQQMGIPTDKLEPQWDQMKVDSLIARFGEEQSAPTTRTIMEGSEKVQQEWNSKTGSWKEVGRGISSQATGAPGDFDSPTKKNLSTIQEERVNSRARLEKQLRGYDNIEKLITNPNFVGGTAGQGISLINSAVAQYKQTTGDSGALIGNRVNINKFDPKSSIYKKMRKSAVVNDALEAATVELAYILAKDNDQGGRVTDKDYEAAKDMMGSSADPASRLEVLRRRREESINSFNDMEKSLSTQYKQYKPSIYDMPKKPEKVETEKTDVDKWIESGDSW